jgi:hypothetical protein
MDTVWDSEFWEGYVVPPVFRVTDPGPLHSPVTRFDLRRTKTQQLTITTRSDVNAAQEEERFPLLPPGTVRRSHQTVTLRSPDAIVLLEGVEPLSWSTRRSVDGSNRSVSGGECRERSSVQSLEWRPTDDGDAHQLIEWVQNTNRHIVLPHGMRDDEQTTITRTLQGGGPEIVFKASSLRRAGSRNCLRIKIGGIELIFGQGSSRDNRTGRKCSGFIFYPQRASSALRRKIRECLSFAMGKPLIYLGETILGSDSTPKGFRAITPNTFQDQAYSLHACPPAPIWSQYQNVMDVQLFSRIVNALFAHYDLLKFEHLSWLYWYALCSPIHAMAGQLGAAIEALQSTYRAVNKPTYATTLLNKDEFHQLSCNVTNVIDQMTITDPIKIGLRNKLSVLNQLSQSQLNDRFYDDLKLPMGVAEKEAWSRRNDSAHGNEIAADDYEDLVRDVKLLRNMLHRTILRITAASDHYVDYYSLNWPTRTLGESVPNPL